MPAQHTNSAQPRSDQRPRSNGGGRGRGRPGGGRGEINFSELASKFATKDVTAATSAQPQVDVVQYVPLGGMEEVGRNCGYYEYGNDVVLVDAGIQFPDQHTPGADYIIPNVASLEAKKSNVRGIILTHGHYDHIAAIHYLLEKLGNPIIYTSRFTKAMVEKRHEEFVNAPKLRFEVVTEGSRVRISEHFEAEFFNIEHTIPEALGFILKTPVGNMVSFGDYRLDIDKDGTPQHLDVFKRLADMGVHSLFLDSTRAESAGHGPSEETVQDNVEGLIKAATGRVVIATFASLVDRLIQIMDIADKLGKKVAIQGHSMTTNLDIAKNLGYLKGRTDHIIAIEDTGKYRDEELIILTTGAQGESNAGLMRIARGEHRFIRFKETDTVIFSSSVVPGNEWAVQELQDMVARQVGEIYTSRTMGIHAGGHAYGGDHELVLSIIKPKFVVPIHGYYFMRKAFMKIAEHAGMQRDQVRLMDNGQVAELTKDTFTITKEQVPTSYVIVDGLGVGDVEEVVLRDRVVLSQEGFVMIIITLDRHTGRMLRYPDIIARGFIQVRDNGAVMDEMKTRIRSLITRMPASTNAGPDHIKSIIRDQIGSYIYQQTHRRPMLVPYIIEL